MPKVKTVEANDECKFGINCRKKKCWFKHTNKKKPAKHVASKNVKDSKSDINNIAECRYGDNCHNKFCRFNHSDKKNSVEQKSLTNVIVQKNDTETSHDSVEEILSLSEIQDIDILNLCSIVEWCSDLKKLRDIYGSIIDYLEMKYNGLVKFPFVGNTAARPNQ
jgi:hypothetical protein